MNATRDQELEGLENTLKNKRKRLYDFIKNSTKTSFCSFFWKHNPILRRLLTSCPDEDCPDRAATGVEPSPRIGQCTVSPWLSNGFKNSVQNCDNLTPE